MSKPKTSAAHRQVDSPQPASSHTPARRLSLWVFVDWLLIVAALASAGWACRTAPMSVEQSFERNVVITSELHDLQASWYIDRANVVRWSTGSAAGATSLRMATTPVPSDVLVLVHPDSLMEPLARTIEVLQQAGAQKVFVALSPHDPFPRSEPASSP